MDKSSKKNINKYFPVIIAVLAFAFYFLALFNKFAYDDHQVISDNSSIHNIKNIGLVFNPHEYSKNFLEASYRPVATVSYLLLFYFGRLNPFFYHLLSLLLHAFNAVLVFYIARELFKNEVNALISGIFFGAFPAFSEAVFCISYNEDLFCTFFYLLSFLFYIKKNKFSILLVPVFLFFSLLSKEMALTFPLVIIVYEIFFGNLYGKKILPDLINKIKEKIFLTGIVMSLLFYIVLRFIVFSNSSGVKYAGHNNLMTRLIYIPFLVFQSIKITVFPMILNADHVFKYPANFFNPENLFSILIFAVIIISLIIYRNKNKIIFFGAFWYLITLIPVLNIFVLYNPVAERYLYLPAVGYLFMLTAIIDLVAENLMTGTQGKLKNSRFIMAFILLVFFAVRTVSRSADWKDDERLWKLTLKASPESFRAYNGVGLSFFEKKDYVIAGEYFERSIAINPKFSSAYYNLGNSDMELSRYDLAIKNFSKAMELDPESPLGYYNIGNVYYKIGKYDDAINYYEKALKINPGYTRALNGAGLISFLNKDFTRAIEYFTRGINSDPSDSSSYNNLANVYSVLENHDQALKYYKAAVSLNPSFDTAYINMGFIYEKKGQINEAAGCYFKAVNLKTGYIIAYMNLGNIYYRQGLIKKALTVWQAGLKINPDNQNLIKNIENANKPINK